jgi:hypothetical protein
MTGLYQVKGMKERADNKKPGNKFAVKGECEINSFSPAATVTQTHANNSIKKHLRVFSLLRSLFIFNSNLIKFPADDYVFI